MSSTGSTIQPSAAQIQSKPVLVSPRCSIVSRTMASVSCLSRMRAVSHAIWSRRSLAS